MLRSRPKSGARKLWNRGRLEQLENYIFKQMDRNREKEEEAQFAFTTIQCSNGWGNNNKAFEKAGGRPNLGFTLDEVRRATGIRLAKRSAMAQSQNKVWHERDLLQPVGRTRDSSLLSPLS